MSNLGKEVRCTLINLGDERDALEDVLALAKTDGDRQCIRTAIRAIRKAMASLEDVSEEAYRRLTEKEVKE